MKFDSFRLLYYFIFSCCVLIRMVCVFESLEWIAQQFSSHFDDINWWWMDEGHLVLNLVLFNHIEIDLIFSKRHTVSMRVANGLRFTNATWFECDDALNWSRDITTSAQNVHRFQGVFCIQMYETINNLNGIGVSKVIDGSLVSLRNEWREHTNERTTERINMYTICRCNVPLARQTKRAGVFLTLSISFSFSLRSCWK